MKTATPAFESARVLDGYVRLRFLPALFGDDFMRAENNVYLYADRFLADYDGGVWDFAQLPSGGGFMKPAAEETWRFVNPANHSDVRLSSEAAGIVITSLVLNHRSWMYDRHDDTELCALYCRRHRQLTDYAFAHPEAAAIFAALD
ncbi:antirestriction protein [Pantoea sp. JGM49]|uniref:antirestriction protein n=1 Tax=Pantoea sp. JGM49 TaxID=2799791 RepID=UPI001BA7A5FC|nr:antirestriction protein [Pantoea sp. JGM49]MBS0883133.1 antirestriction protein [Pantoea sp. JGM49]